MISDTLSLTLVTAIAQNQVSLCFHPCKCSYPRGFESQLQNKDQVTCLPKTNHILLVSFEAQPITTATAYNDVTVHFLLSSPLRTSLTHPSPASSSSRRPGKLLPWGLCTCYSLCLQHCPPIIFRLFPSLSSRLCSNITFSVKPSLNIPFITEFPILDCLTFSWRHLCSLVHCTFTYWFVLCLSVSLLECHLHKAGSFVHFATISPVPTILSGTWQVFNKYLANQRIIFLKQYRYVLIDPYADHEVEVQGVARRMHKGLSWHCSHGRGRSGDKELTPCCRWSPLCSVTRPGRCTRIGVTC